MKWGIGLFLKREVVKPNWEIPGGGSHIDMVYVYVPAFWVTFSQNLV